MDFDLIVRRARLRGEKGVKDIAVRDGRFVEIADRVEAKAREEVDAEGRLVSPSFVDSHLHLDAVLTVGEPRYNMSGTLLEGIATWALRKETLTFEDVKRRATEAIKWEVAQGVGYIRTHVDVCDPNLTALKALLEVRRECQDLVDLQIVAFPQEGIISYEGGKELMEEAIRLGADVVGGIPHYEFTREYGLESLDFVFDLARRYDRLIDVHCDETDDDHSRFVETLAARTIREGMQGRVTAGHTTAMHSYNNAYAFKLFGVLKRAQMNMVTNPLDNSILQGRFDTYPKRRGLTRVKELLEAGINVSVGHDSIMDPWYPLGRGSMLQAAFVLLHFAHMSGYEEIFRVFDTITVNGAKTLHVEDKYGIEVGKQADLVVLDAEDEFEALRLLPPCLYVIKRGKVVAKTEPSMSFLPTRGEAVTFTRNRS